MGCSTVNNKGETTEDRIGQLEDGFKELWAIHEAQQNKITIQDKRITNLYDEQLKISKDIAIIKQEMTILRERSLDAKYDKHSWE